MAKIERQTHDDSWIANLSDILSKPTHRIKLFADVKNGNQIILKIEHDDLKAVETIIDEYDEYTKPRAFHDSFTAFIYELPTGIKLEVEQTNVFYLFEEVITDQRANAKRMRQLLKERNIDLILTAKNSNFKRKGRK